MWSRSGLLPRRATRARCAARAQGVVSFDEFNAYVTRHVLQRAHHEQQLAERTARRALSQNALLERRVAELAPGLAEEGMHRNRKLLFGGDAPAADAVLMRSNDYLCLSGHPAIASARAAAMAGWPDRHR